jgi:hypothetical protein
MQVSRGVWDGLRVTFRAAHPSWARREARRLARLGMLPESVRWRRAASTLNTEPWPMAHGPWAAVLGIEAHARVLPSSGAVGSQLPPRNRAGAAQSGAETARAANPTWRRQKGQAAGRQDSGCTRRSPKSKAQRQTGDAQVQQRLRVSTPDAALQHPRAAGGGDLCASSSPALLLACPQARTRRVVARPALAALADPHTCTCT